MDKLFFDTNVLLDVLEERYPHFPDSLECLDIAMSKQFKAAMTALSLSNIAYLQRSLSTAEICAGLTKLRDGLAVATIDQECVDTAFDLRLSDFEDALQFQSALQWGATHLLTRNVRDFPSDHSKLKVLSPSNYLISTE